jgi:hypothetical protein
MRPTEPDTFVAILVFDYGSGARGIEPLVVRATHPEIAYECALAKGSERRPDRSFAGLADLYVATEDVPLVGKIEQGAAEELVVAKDRLAVFAAGTWAQVLCDPAELAAALAEPPYLVELVGIDDLPWQEMSHAYGPSIDVPSDLKRVASSDPRIRKNALWNLSGNIYHQGDIFDSTAAALPFLVTLAGSQLLPNRKEILELIKAIAESAATVDPEAIRRRWAERERRAPDVPTVRPAGEMAETEIAYKLAVRAAMAASIATLTGLYNDSNPEVASAARAVVQAFSSRRAGGTDAR